MPYTPPSTIIVFPLAEILDNEMERLNLLNNHRIISLKKSKNFIAVAVRQKQGSQEIQRELMEAEAQLRRRELL